MKKKKKQENFLKNGKKIKCENKRKLKLKLKRKNRIPLSWREEATSWQGMNEQVQAGNFLRIIRTVGQMVAII